MTIASKDSSEKAGLSVHRAKRISGLDSIRFVAAMFVVFGHLGSLPLMEGVDESQIIPYILQGIYNNFFSGPAAVIVFFLISGFCIHYPYGVLRKKLVLTQFLLARYIRLGLPLLAIVGVYLMSEIPINWEKGIFWTLIAELVYYTIYPALRAFAEQFSWRFLIFVSFPISAFVILTSPESGDYASFGNQLNWLLGLPCWLLGVYLAEQCKNLSSVAISNQKIWTYRFGVWFLSVACRMLRFHTPLGHPITLNLFAIVVYFWLRAEISFRLQQSSEQRSRVFLILEKFGLWSYSIYLCHMVVNDIVLENIPFSNFGYMLGWTFEMLTLLIICFVFYQVIEKPTHVLAKLFSSKRA